MLILDGGLDGGSLTPLPPLTHRTVSDLLWAVHDGLVFWVDYDRKSYQVNRWQPNILVHDVTDLMEDWADRGLVRLASGPGGGRRVWKSTTRSVALMQNPDLPCTPKIWREKHSGRLWRHACDSWHPGGAAIRETDAVAAAVAHVAAMQQAADRADTRAAKAADARRRHDNHKGLPVACDCRRAGVECHCYSDDLIGLPTTTSGDDLWWELRTKTGPRQLDNDDPHHREY